MSGSIGPSLDLNLLGPTLDPSITFTRASTATYFDVTGTLQTAASGAPRFDYDPVALTPRGLLIEESRTNSLRNSMMTGAVVGTPGTIPTNWTKASATGVAWNVIGTGVENGITYIDLELVGTSSAGVVNNMIFDSTTIIPASSGQVWTGSVYVKLIAGSLSGLQVSLNTTEQPGGNQIGAFFTPTGAALATQRYAVTGTVTATGTSMVHFIRIITPTPPATVDVTLRIGAPQFELGAFATSFIPTTTVAVTRAVDAATFPVGAWYNTTSGSWCAEIILNGANTVGGRIVATSTSRGAPLLMNATTSNVGIYDASNVVFTANALTVGVIAKAASTWEAGTARVLLNAGAIASANLTNGFSTVTTYKLFADNTASDQTTGCVRRITYWPRALSNSELQAATSLSGPLLDLYLTGPTLPTGLTLTRSTTGTYVDATGTVQTAAINAPRFGYDPISHAPLGLLIEETRTNLAYPSVDQSAAGWGISPAACLLATGNAGIAPDGTNTATSVVTNDTVASSHNLFRSYAGGTINTTYCGSLFAKAGAYPRVSVTFGNTAFPAGATGGLFDLTTGTIVAMSGTTVCSITPYPNGWYRLSVTATSNATGGSYVFGFNPNPATATTVSGNFTPASTGLGIFTWGAQVETSAFLTAPTSYIPTTTTSVARAFDLCSMPTAAWYNASLGSFAVDGTMQQVFAGNQDIVGFDDGSISNCTIARCGATSFQIVEASAGVGQPVVNTANTILPGTPFRAAMTYNAGALTGSLNGGAVVSTSGTAPVSTNRLNLSAVRQAAQNGFKSRVRYWPRVLANVELQEATSLGVQARAMVLA
jgi:hypothetical protein